MGTASLSRRGEGGREISRDSFGGKGIARRGTGRERKRVVAGQREGRGDREIANGD